MNTNPLEKFPKVRNMLYNTYWVVGVVLGAIPVAYAAIAQTVPVWSLAVMAVYGYLGIALGFTAGKNVNLDEEEE